MTCVSTVSYAVLVNGQHAPVFSPFRGLCQGDPIFPYLYLLCTEGLSSLINVVERISMIYGVNVARGSPSINHLFFTNDSIIFYRAKVSEWNAIQKVLDIYVVAVGQWINKQKTGIIFSSNTIRTFREQILSVVGVSLCTNQEKYLALPMVVGRNRYRTFEIIKDKVWSHINNWKNIFLSQADKDILLNSMVQAILTYAMSMFKLPHCTFKEITSQMAKF